LKESNLHLLYKGSGRYVYAIRQLRAEVGFVDSPCTPGKRHRWMIVHSGSCPTTSGISSDTINALTYIIQDQSRVSYNDVYIDVNDMISSPISYYGYVCDASNKNTIGMMFSTYIWYTGNTTCIKHAHPDEGNVYDFTYWARPDTHPGNAAAMADGRRNPITKFAEYNNNFTLLFPNWHTMDRWRDNKEKIYLIGRSFDNVKFIDLPPMLRTQAVANMFTTQSNNTQAVVVCGSQGEISNNASYANIFSFANGTALLTFFVQPPDVYVYI
jgi:hypothetical protein